MLNRNLVFYFGVFIGVYSAFSFGDTFTTGVVTTKKTSELNKVYGDVSDIKPYFQHGKVIFNTSMPDDGSLHFFTDNRGFDWGPTTIYQRSASGKLESVRLEHMKIPADVHVSPNGNTLYFVDYGDNPSRLYRSLRKGDVWQKPQHLTVLDLPKGSSYLTSTRSGILYFVSDGDIYRYDGRDLKKLPSEINTQQGEHDPFISQDEKFLIIVREDGKGDSNMYLSLKTKQGWTTAEKLPAPFNAEKVDGSPYVTPDRKYIFFSSNRENDVLQTWQAPFLEYISLKLSQLE